MANFACTEFSDVHSLQRSDLGALLELFPGGVVAFLEVLGRCVWVSVVAQSENRAIDVRDEPGGCLVALRGAVGYVARRVDHRGAVPDDSQQR
jgi:hypothetical protein